MRTCYAVQQTKEALDVETEGQVGSSQPFHPLVTNGLFRSPVPAPGQIQHGILILNFLNTSTEGDTVKPSLRGTLLPFILGHSTCFVSLLPVCLRPLSSTGFSSSSRLCKLAWPTAQSQPPSFHCVISSSPMASKTVYMLMIPTFYLQTQCFPS